jgi:NADH-quinone oxidoreductase subunit M
MQQSAIPNILSVLTFLPLVGALLVMCLPRPRNLEEAHGDHDAAHSEPTVVPEDPARLLVNWTALAFALLTFLLSLALFGAFQLNYVDPSTRNMQFLEQAHWISFGKIDIFYRMGVDGISLLLIVLTTFLMVLCVLFSFNTKQRLKEFMVFLLLLETGMIGVFCALDLVLFYFFWEAMLIPMYFLIGIFGHENRIYAAIKFFLYTFAGSILMLIAIVSIYQVSGSFNVMELSNPTSAGGVRLHTYSEHGLLMMFAAFALAFMIKVPMFPFHTWLPDAHVEAPTAGSVILAGVLLKMGTYGFVRFCLPLFPQAAHDSAPLFIILAIVGIVYGSMVSAVQPDAKKLVAYSSVAHLGFVVLGIFTFTRIGMMGALIQNINHGISTPMLFFLVGMLYERRHTRQISEFGGLKKIVPMMAAMLLLATLSSIAVPLFNGFVGEFTVLQGSFISSQTNTMGGIWPTALAGTGMILSAVYMLWWYQRLMLGPVTKPINRHLPDLTRTEWLVLTPMVAMIFWIGLGSTFWTERMETSVNTLLPTGGERIREDLPISQVLEKYSFTQQLRDSLRRPHLLPPGDMKTAPPSIPSGERAPAPPPIQPPTSQPNTKPGGSPDQNHTRRPDGRTFTLRVGPGTEAPSRL